MTCPVNYNPADFFIKNLAIWPEEEIKSRKNVQIICDSYETSDAHKNVSQQIIECSKAKKHSNPSEDKQVLKNKKSPYRANWCMQFRQVFVRSCISVIRNPLIVFVKGFSALVYSFKYLKQMALITLFGCCLFSL